MQTFLSAFAIAITAIITNKTRALLTMLGVIIGVGSVVLLTAIGTGLQSYITEQFNSFGATNIFVMPGDMFGEGGGFNAERQQAALSNNKLKVSDVKTLERLREYVTAAAPEYTAFAKVSFGDKSKETTIYGTNEKYGSITSTIAEKGRFLEESDILSDARVAVLGPETATELFGKIDPIGKKIRISSQTFRVIGVSEAKGGGFGGPTFDTYVFVPIDVAHKLFNASSINQITVQARSREVMPEAIQAIEKEMGKRLKDDEFSVIDQTKILETINQVLGALTTGLGGIAAISLVVGGIGILNIMLVSVIERTREIGLRKALGATPNIILVQFLIEAATLSVLGGLMGTGLAFGLSLLINQFVPAVVTIEAVALAFGVSAIVGIVFGVIPARRASKLSPIEALRYE